MRSIKKFSPQLEILENKVVLSTFKSNAFIDFGSAPYAEAAQIITGTAKPWYQSIQLPRLFGGHAPTGREQSNFIGRVLDFTRKTFTVSGVNVKLSLTGTPNVIAPHTMSVVANASSRAFPGAIGTTDVGRNGFSFIDVEAKAAHNLNDLEWIVAHNIAHELMLAFGVTESYDKSGQYVDAAHATYEMMANPDSKFSASASTALNRIKL
jgi:hypothetical protein